jgi:hypothetical protein
MTPKINIGCSEENSKVSETEGEIILKPKLKTMPI